MTETATRTAAVRKGRAVQILDLDAPIVDLVDALIDLGYYPEDAEDHAMILVNAETCLLTDGTHPIASDGDDLCPRCRAAMNRAGL